MLNKCLESTRIQKAEKRDSSVGRGLGATWGLWGPRPWLLVAATTASTLPLQVPGAIPASERGAR